MNARQRRLKEARVGRFKSMADFEWAWPTQIHRPSVERILTLEFVAKRENTIWSRPRVGKTMLAKNLVYEAVLAGHSARFITASDLILDLTAQETACAAWTDGCAPTAVRRCSALTKSGTSRTTPMRLHR